MFLLATGCAYDRDGELTQGNVAAGDLQDIAEIPWNREPGLDRDDNQKVRCVYLSENPFYGYSEQSQHFAW